MRKLSAEGVLITGVYGSGKSAAAQEIAYLLEQCHQSYALLDLDFLGWGIDGSGDEEARFRLMLRNLAAVVANYREVGISLFVVSSFVADEAQLNGVRQAIGVPLRVVRLSVPLPEIERRLATDATTERHIEHSEAARQLRDGAGVGLEDVVVGNDRPLGIVAREIMDRLGWPRPD